MSTGTHVSGSRHCTVGLLLIAALFLAPGAGAGGREASAGAAQASAAATLEGTWRVEVTLRQCDTGLPIAEPFPALATFARGGTVTTSDGGMSPAQRGPGHGVWWRLQGRSFAAVTEAFLFGSTGVLTGTQRLSQTIELDAAARAFQASVSARVTNVAGHVVFTGCATSEGRRLD